jgi:hypothetical protein
MKTNLPALKVDERGRYLVRHDRSPFFWLGDTAWELLHRLTLEETRFYFQTRIDQGFTIIQTVVLAELDGLKVPNANGDLPLTDLDPTQPNEAYFSHVDQVIRLAAEMGVYLALLPTWGDKFNQKWGKGPEIFTPSNAKDYGAFLARRYAKYTHIIWVLGGDRLPEDAEDTSIIEQMAEGLRTFDPESLITYHPGGGVIASDLFDKADWLQVDMFQSRHQKKFKEYRFVRKARNRHPVRPVINGEPGYENIPNLLNKWHFQRLEASDIRLAAYWSMLSGAAGHTYGCNEVWQMHASARDSLFGAQMSWDKALDLPGASQMGILRQIIESLPWQQMKPSQELIAGIKWSFSAIKVAMATLDKSCILAYLPGGNKIKLKLKKSELNQCKAYWIDPRNGEVSAIKNKPSREFNAPNRLQDWLLLVLSEEQLNHWNYPRS